MTVVAKSSQTRPWAKGVLHTAQEFAPTPLEILSGSLPTGLRGTLYRNGPGRLERNGQPVAHWFDGDGGILAVHFTDRGATGTYRYVQTEGYCQEEKAGHYLFAGYGMLSPGSWLGRFTKDVKNAANTSVIALPDKLLALWEGGAPHALALDTLETFGLDDLGGLEGANYSAHPKREPGGGDIFNFGIKAGKDAALHVYRSDKMGRIRQKTAIALDGVPLIHDFVMAGRYLVFCIPPVRMNAIPVLARIKSFSDSLQWQPQKGTQILVLDKDTLQVVSRSEAAAWYQWHYANGYEQSDGSLIVHLVRFPDFQTNQNLKEVAGGAIQTPAKGTLWQLRLDPQTGKLLEMAELHDRACEFPTVQPQEVGKPSRYTYLSIRRADLADNDSELFTAIARFDHHRGILTEADLGRDRYPNEPIYAPDCDNPEKGWIVTVVYDGTTDSSEVWVYDADGLDREPACRLALPTVIPLGFHGTWRSADV
jgi:carotenoid cleavage dioxygenase-like enzyme